MKVIGIGGYAGSGKDTAAAYFVREHGYTRMAFADILRDAIYTLNPVVDDVYRVQDIVDATSWDEAKRNYSEVRRLLQVMGTEVGRQQWDDNFWVDMLFGRAERLGIQKLVISDVRFPNELNALHDRAGVSVWIERPGVGPVNAHPSDNSLGINDFAWQMHNVGSVEFLHTLLEQVLVDWRLDAFDDEPF